MDNLYYNIVYVWREVDYNQIYAASALFNFLFDLKI